MRLDVATVLVQWSAGGLLGCWVTTRHRLVGLGYGWLLRSVFAVLALGGVASGLAESTQSAGAAVRDAAALVMACSAPRALVVAVVRRRAGVADEGSFNPTLDLLAPCAGLIALVGAAEAVG